ncbi:MAG: hypothetical protein ACPGID_11185 [Rubricella sp.]
MKTFTAALALLLVAGCSGFDTIDSDGQESGVDRGIDSHPLATMRPSLWVDPLGCEHWIIDDGVEGYLTNRVNPDGTPRCNPPRAN